MGGVGGAVGGVGDGVPAAEAPAPPEVFEPGLRRALIAFAWMTWAWRLVVFVGIAVAVYHFFFKALGIFLFLIEIGWFLARPVAAELGQWLALRRHAEAGHVARSLLVVIAAFAVLAVPWRGSVTAEGLLHAERQLTVYAPLPSRLAGPVRAGDYRAGEPLVILDSPDIRQRVLEHQVSAQGLERQLVLGVGSAQGRERRALLAERLERERVALAGERSQLDRLEPMAPFDGRLTDVDETLRPGSWIGPGQPIAILHDPRSWVVDAYLGQQDLSRIVVGAVVRFHLHHRPEAPLSGTVQAIDTDRQQRFAHPLLAVEHGGRLPAIRGPDGRLLPREALYRVRILIDADLADRRSPSREMPGTARIDAEPRSVLAEWGRNVLAVLIRESGF